MKNDGFNRDKNEGIMVVAYTMIAIFIGFGFLSGWLGHMFFRKSTTTTVCGCDNN